MGRPRTPIGAFGDITYIKVAGGRIRARTRYRDDDGQLRSDVLQLPRHGGNIVSTIDVLEAAGLLIEDRSRPIEEYFATKAAGLPPVMREQLEVWMKILLDRATTAPRQRSRDLSTMRIRIRSFVPAVTTWAEAGHHSLAEITPAQVRAVLPEAGAQRVLAEQGLRPLFKTLKTHKLIFANPMRGMKAPGPTRRCRCRWTPLSCARS